TFPDGSQQTIATTGQRYLDQFVLSLQLGYKLKNTILRAGIIESRGGAAIEQTFKADTFRVGGEIWDFTRPDLNGHLKLYTRWNASPNLYVTGGVDDLLNPGLRSPFLGAEEAARQVRRRADRLDVSAPGLFLLPETSLEAILEAVKAGTFGAIVVDSIQTIASADAPAAAGSVTQVRACAGRLLALAKTTGVPVLLIGHVTKDGTLAGPKTLEHLVDAVLSFEGERFHAHRVVRALKNRFGPVHELGIFEMTGAGLIEVANPSALYLGSGAGGRPGSVVLAGVEGTRPLLLEVQAL